MCIQTNQNENDQFNALPSLAIGDYDLEVQASAVFLGARLGNTLCRDHQGWGGKACRGLYVMGMIRKLGSHQLPRIVYFSLFETHHILDSFVWGSYLGNFNTISIWQKRP